MFQNKANYKKFGVYYICIEDNKVWDTKFDLVSKNKIGVGI